MHRPRRHRREGGCAGAARGRERRTSRVHSPVSSSTWRTARAATERAWSAAPSSDKCISATCDATVASTAASTPSSPAPPPSPPLPSHASAAPSAPADGWRICPAAPRARAGGAAGRGRAEAGAGTYMPRRCENCIGTPGAHTERPRGGPGVTRRGSAARRIAANSSAGARLYSRDTARMRRSTTAAAAAASAGAAAGASGATRTRLSRTSPSMAAVLRTKTLALRPPLSLPASFSVSGWAATLHPSAPAPSSPGADWRGAKRAASCSKTLARKAAAPPAFAPGRISHACDAALRPARGAAAHASRRPATACERSRETRCSPPAGPARGVRAVWG